MSERIAEAVERARRGGAEKYHQKLAEQGKLFVRERLRLRFRIARAAGLGEIAKRDIGQAVTGRTDLLVDLQAALQRAAIEFADRTGERPFLRRRGIRMVLGASSKAHLTRSTSSTG